MLLGKLGERDASGPSQLAAAASRAAVAASTSASCVSRSGTASGCAPFLMMVSTVLRPTRLARYDREPSLADSVDRGLTGVGLLLGVSLLGGRQLRDDRIRVLVFADLDLDEALGVRKALIEGQHRLLEAGDDLRVVGPVGGGCRQHAADEHAFEFDGPAKAVGELHQ